MIIRYENEIPIDDLVHRVDQYCMTGSITFVDPCSVCNRIKDLERIIEVQKELIDKLKGGK